MFCCDFHYNSFEKSIKKVYIHGRKHTSIFLRNVNKALKNSAWNCPILSTLNFPVPNRVICTYKTLLICVEFHRIYLAFIKK